VAGKKTTAYSPLTAAALFYCLAWWYGSISKKSRRCGEVRRLCEWSKMLTNLNAIWSAQDLEVLTATYLATATLVNAVAFSLN